MFVNQPIQAFANSDHKFYQPRNEGFFMQSRVLHAPFKRAILVILDSVGIGATQDCKEYKDSPSVNTLGNTTRHAGGLDLKNLAELGLGLLGDFMGVKPITPKSGIVARCLPKSKGKDTTTGHWEIAGILTRDPFQTFLEGFPDRLIQSFIKENNLPGILANHAGSGTELIDRYGAQHLATLRPIVYTSADSVFQIACHEEAFGLERLYKLCESARKLCDEYRISRVIARPFLGTDPSTFKRTPNRKDYSIPLSGKILFDYLKELGINTHTIGKIANIYNFQSIASIAKTTDNADGIAKLLEALDKHKEGLIVINLLDFDQEYGHRRNPAGYAKALLEFDAALADILAKVQKEDLLVITADHGNDPTAPGTDHTREMVPLIIHSPRFDSGKKHDDIQGFDVVGGTIFEALTAMPSQFGHSLFQKFREL
jgi:phosphopentomutase